MSIGAYKPGWLRNLNKTTIQKKRVFLNLIYTCVFKYDSFSETSHYCWFTAQNQINRHRKMTNLRCWWWWCSCLKMQKRSIKNKGDYFQWAKICFNCNMCWTFFERVLTAVDEFRPISLPGALSGLSLCPHITRYPYHKTVVHHFPLTSPCMFSYHVGGFLWP